MPYNSGMQGSLSGGGLGQTLGNLAQGGGQAFAQVGNTVDLDPIDVTTSFYNPDPSNYFSDPRGGSGVGQGLGMQPLTNAQQFMPYITNRDSGAGVVGGQIPSRYFGRQYGPLPDVENVFISQPNEFPSTRDDRLDLTDFNTRFGDPNQFTPTPTDVFNDRYPTYLPNELGGKGDRLDGSFPTDRFPTDDVFTPQPQPQPQPTDEIANLNRSISDLIPSNSDLIPSNNTRGGDNDPFAPVQPAPVQDAFTNFDPFGGTGRIQSTDRAVGVNTANEFFNYDPTYGGNNLGFGGQSAADNARREGRGPSANALAQRARYLATGQV
jgi:hypothetical protein